MFGESEDKGGSSDPLDMCERLRQAAPCAKRTEDTEDTLEATRREVQGAVT